MGSDEDADEFDVGVSFFGPDFVLTVRWTTSHGVDDDTRTDAAATWFTETYGFNPAEHASRIAVEPLPDI